MCVRDAGAANGPRCQRSSVTAAAAAAAATTAAEAEAAAAAAIIRTITRLAPEC